jgi:hypothetical protein
MPSETVKLSRRDEEIVRIITVAIETRMTDLKQDEVAELREVLEMKNNIEILFKFGNLGKRFIIGLSGFLVALLAIINTFPSIRRFFGLP